MRENSAMSSAQCRGPGPASKGLVQLPALVRITRPARDSVRADKSRWAAFRPSSLESRSGGERLPSHTTIEIANCSGLGASSAMPTPTCAWTADASRLRLISVILID